jgi:5-hydroxyisourate hydrolase
MSTITTHVLDTSVGRPAAGIPVSLERSAGGGAWELVGRAETDADGRARSIVPSGSALLSGIYRLTFHTAPYFQRSNTRTFYPSVSVEFEVADAAAHYHVPLLISPFGYSTYRGS